MARVDGLVDIVLDEAGTPVFLMVDGTVHRDLPVDGETLAPAVPRELGWEAPRLEGVVEKMRYFEADGTGEAARLFNEAVSYLKRFSCLPTPDYYPLLAGWMMHTYRLDWFQYSPIVFLHGVAERGKSRTGKALAFGSHRGIVTETLNEAPLFRLAEHAQPTMFIDVVDLETKMAKRGSLDFINGRFERGVGVRRVLRVEDDGLDSIKNYQVFGPTVVAANYIREERLMSRGLFVLMPEATEHFPSPVESADGLPLREWLTAWRWWTMKHGMVPDASVTGLRTGRFYDITQPVRQVAALVSPGHLHLVDAALGHLYDQRMADKSGGPEADLVRAVAKLGPSSGGRLTTKAVREEFLSITGWDRVSDQYVGRQLTALGFPQTSFMQDGSKKRGIIYVPDLVEKLAVKYGLER